jgi:hypothetical protein
MAQKGNDYPRHTIEKSLRIPKGIIEQNAGKDCSDEEAAAFIGIKYNKGPFASELSSCVKYGLLSRPEAGQLSITEICKKILKPQNQSDVIDGYRKALFSAPVFSEVYLNYRGENLPDEEFFTNALTDKFKVPISNVAEFKTIFIDALEISKLIVDSNNKKRILDEIEQSEQSQKSDDKLKALEKDIKLEKGDSCFVMMPFSGIIGTYYEKIFKPSIEKTGLTPLRADDDMFGSGKIIDQIWEGINTSKVLLAELTTRNPNVFYELGIAHTLQKPVVLISSTEDDVPFDLKHIRVIYYDMSDPFWGTKLIDKIAENILSAIKNPKESIVFAKK